jgi:Na+/melibiose symporter-like transporter
VRVRPALTSSFWRLFASSGTSNLADGMALIVMPLLAASITRDPVQISALVAVAYLPWLVLAVPGGALVDRLDRRRAMAMANTARAVLFAVLGILVAADLVSMWLIYVTTALVGVAEVIYDSAARAILPQVVGKEGLDRGNSFMTVVETVGNQFAGAPLGAFLFAAVAAVPVFGASAGYLVAAALILTVRGGFRPERGAPTTLRADVVEGMRWLWGHRFLRGLTLSAGWFGVMQAMVNGVLVLYALQTLDLSEREFGFLIVAAATGSVCGGLLAPSLSKAYGRGPTLVGATLVSPVCLIGMGLTSTPWVAAGLFAMSAGAVTVWNVLSMSVRQAMIPAQLFGRVLGSYRMVIWGVIPLGALAGGVLASRTSLGAVLVVAGVGQLSAAAWIAALMRTHRDEIASAYEESIAPAGR